MNNSQENIAGSVNKDCLTTECSTRRWIIQERDRTFNLMHARVSYLEEALERVSTSNNLPFIWDVARAALEGKDGKKELSWPNPSPPTKGISHYDYIKAHGFTIEWKSWKDHPQYCLMRDRIDEQFLGTFATLDEAKEAARAALEGKDD
jgi:hypothetical protein